MVEQFGRVHTAIVMRLAMTNAKAVSRRQRLFRLPYNRSVTDSHHPRRIACLQPSATVILASVGELDRVVACTKYCVDVVPGLRDDALRNNALRNDASRNDARLIIADSWTSKAAEIL